MELLNRASSSSASMNRLTMTADTSMPIAGLSRLSVEGALVEKPRGSRDELQETSYLVEEGLVRIGRL